MRPLSGRRRLLIVFVVVAGILAIGMIRMAFMVSAMRSLQATGPNWSFPSRVFSDGVSLEAGRPLPEAYLMSEMQARGYRSAGSTNVVPGTWARTSDGFVIGLRGFPDEPDPAGSGGPERVRIGLQNGRLVRVERLGAFEGAPAPDLDHPPRLEPVLVSLLFDEQRIWRTWVSLERVPEPVRDAVIASEDRRFRSHGGIDPRGTLRALFTNVRSGEVREGGSTITQQLARGLFLGRKRTLVRKLAEMPLAVGLELLLSKDQILEMYLNSVYWGQAQGFGIGGVAEAARWYFDAPVESLTVLQGATLAAMIPAPNVVNPFEAPALTLERRNRVLRELVETGRLAEADAARLATRPLAVRRGALPIEQFLSYTGYVRDVIDDDLSKHAATSFGLSVFTTMDLAWQGQAEAALASGLAALDGGSRRRIRLEGAFVALEPATSAVRAMVGGRAPHAGDFNRAYQARRQTGSAIKPIVYAAALSSAMGFTPATVLPDTQRTFGRGRWAWRPKNYDGVYHEQVTLAKALEKSLNVATASLVDMIGPGTVAQLAREMGLGSLRAVPSIGLGSNEVSLLDLTNAYTAFVNQGRLHAPSPLRAVIARSGRTILEPPHDTTQPLSEGIAALMTGLLENVVRYGVAYPLQATYGFERPAAGKTGTTDDYKDAWFVGFTPDIVAGTWVGYDRPRSIGIQAAHTALPIWARTVGAMLRGFPPAPFAIETELEWADMEPWTGLLADSLCGGETTPFLPGTTPRVFCSEVTPYGTENLDSLYGRDSTWSTEPDSLPPEPGEGAPADTAAADTTDSGEI
jgi:penicillin-binding protein 1B